MNIGKAPPPRLNPKSAREYAREYAYRVLKEQILNFSLPPGTALTEQEIADRLQLSRTPVREAFFQLSQEGLLDILPQKGSYVSLIDLKSVADAKFLRETLDTAVIKLACANFAMEDLFELQSSLTLQELCLNEKNYPKFFELNEAFHKAIYIGCGQESIWNLMQQMQAHYNRVRFLNQRWFNLPVVLSQHRKLVQAIQEKNVAMGVETTISHLNEVTIDIKHLLADYKSYFKS